MFKLYLTDLKKYKKYSGKNAIVLMITQQGLWALFFYRINHSVYTSKIPKAIKFGLLLFCVISQKCIEIITGISLPYSAKIGRSFYIGHFGNIILNANAVIGNNCNISQGVTIGVSGKGEKRGVPNIKDNVYIGANAVVVGKIVIGEGAVIGANSLVITNVPDGCTVVGVPAQIMSNNNSSAYI